ncbi:Carboxymethylenebutenolidase [Granulibacter bethesdensis]|nr:Carboxymethylenebutenolidase [Granulibacter bethesdensis]
MQRRGFLMTSLIGGFSTAAGAAHADAIHTGTNGITAGEQRIKVSDGEIPAYVASPQGKGPFPTVLVIEEIFGVHEYIRDVCRRLAHAGFMAVAPELYARLGDLSKMSDVQTILRDVISKAPDATVFDDLDHAATWAAAHGGSADRLGVIGFCRGGRDVWLYATHNPKLKAAVAYYGPVKTEDTAIQPHSPLDVADQLKCPLLGLYGGQDKMIDPADVQKAANKATAAGKRVEIVNYYMADHGFHADYRPTYNEAVAKNAWERTLGWLRDHGVR